MEVHICQAHLPYRLQILRLLCLGDTSSRCGEVEVGFFKERRIASLLMGSSNSIFKWSSRRRIVQRAWPSGTGPQATSMIFASVLPSILRRALSELMFLLIFNTSSIPPEAKSFTVFAIVARLTLHADDLHQDL